MSTFRENRIDEVSYDPRKSYPPISFIYFICEVHDKQVETKTRDETEKRDIQLSRARTARALLGYPSVWNG